MRICYSLSRLLGLFTALCLLGFSSFALSQESTNTGAAPKHTRPPLNPAVLEGPGCIINVESHRSKYANLYGFLGETAFSGSTEVFATRREAMQYYFSQRRLAISDIRALANTPDAPRLSKKAVRKDIREARLELREQRQALRSEIRNLRAEFPQGACRKLAWSILGQSDVSDEAIEANSSEGISDSEPVED
jgi:hypothetical protein